MNSFRIIIELILLVQFTQCSHFTVNTTCGMLCGTEFETRNGRIVAAFHGIPYAKPPIGQLRFQDPQLPEPWSDVREAYNFGSVCVQISYIFATISTTKLGNEDCRYLSVYSPNLKPAKLLPVQVHIHGGEMFSGSGEVDKSPAFFLDYETVIVMPNFRLGVLGFLTMEDDVMPGNLGLKDQNMALKWVQNNIANFGGDPNQVTLLGDSAGGIFVHYHMYSPMSRGLFHRAISQSGVALTAWANTPPGIARSRAIKMAKLFNCCTDSSEIILNCLRTKNANELTESYLKFREFQLDPFVVFEPISDKNASNPFIPFNPHDAEPAPVPWIVGVDSLAGLSRNGDFVRNPDTLVEFDQNFIRAAPVSLMYGDTATNPEEVTKKIREFYFGDQPITMSLFRNLTDMYTDALFIWPAVEAINKHKGPHYLYYFDYLGEHSFQEIYAGKRVLTGSTKMDEPIYTGRVKNPIEIPPPSTSEDLYISKLLVELIYNYASSGEPILPGSDLTWSKWDSQEQNFIYIGNNGVTSNRSLLPDRMRFWSQLNFRDKVDGNR